MKSLIKKFIPSFLINWYHFSLAFLGAIFYRFPSQKLTIIGITGTNGKSTVVELTAKILERAGYKTASLSSIKFKIGEKEWPNTLKMTMPGRLKLQRFLRQAATEGCQYVVLEVTSEGISQHRHKFIDFDVAVFTNLTPEHIEAHGSFKNYRAAKGKLFQATKEIHVINLDDENVEYFLKFDANEKYVYTMNNEQKTKNNNSYKKLLTVHCSLFTSGPSGVSFEVQNTKFNLKLLGEFNGYNALAAICVGVSQGIDLEICKKALEKVEGIPGRMEIVISGPFKVFIDYAFTPAALEKVYQTLKPKGARMICVLGACGGGRDKWKRPVLGEIAAKYCNQIIITNEDPYNEDPNQILSQIKSGIFKSPGCLKADSPEGCFPITNFYEILDRREAIRESLKLASSNDVVIITGKGCEPWICVERGKKIPWDDREVVKEEFRKLKDKK